MKRLALAGIGLASLALAVGAPPPALEGATRRALAVAGSDYAVLVALAGLVTVLGGFALAEGRSDSRADDRPTPERPTDAPPPGADLDATLSGASSDPELDDAGRVAVRERLCDAAVATLVRVEGLDRSDARRRVETGEWPPDPVASAFLAGAGPPPRRVRLWRWLAGESWWTWRARRAALAVLERAEEAG